MSELHDSEKKAKRKNQEKELQKTLESVGIDALSRSIKGGLSDVFEETVEDQKNEDQEALDERENLEQEDKFWDHVLLRDKINEEINNFNNDIYDFNKRYVQMDAIEQMVNDIISSLEKDIVKPRNEEAHQKIDTEQYTYEIREKAKRYYEHINKWRFVFRIRGNLAKYDELIGKAKRTYDKFSANGMLTIPLGGNECTTLDELIDAIADNWDLGIELLKANESIPRFIRQESELLISTYNILSGVVQDVIKREQECRINEVVEAKKRRYDIKAFNSSIYNDYKLCYDDCMFKFIYGVRPSYEKFCWRGLSLNMEAFAKLYIERMLEFNDDDTVYVWLRIQGLDRLAEYGLFSYFFQMKNASLGVGEKKYDLDLIGKAELSILKTDKVYKGTNRPYIDLYELYYYLIKLSEQFGKKYVYKIRNIERYSEDL